MHGNALDEKQNNTSGGAKHDSNVSIYTFKYSLKPFLVQIHLFNQNHAKIFNNIKR